MRTASGIILSVFTVMCLALSVSATTLYVDVNGTNSTAPYSDWSTAATNIQDAVDAANAGDLILVNDGTYQDGGRVVYGSLTNRVVIDKPVTVQSVNGPDVTIIQGAPDPATTVGDFAVRCVYLTNNAVLSGFTLTQGATRDDGDGNTEQSGGGIWCESTNIIITNCVLTANIANVSGGGIVSGSLFNCTLLGNSTYGNGGGASSSTLNGCTLNGNEATYDGGGVTGGQLFGCTLINNTASSFNGGGAYSAYLNGCVLIANFAGSAGGGSIYCTLTNCILATNSVGYNGAGGGDYGSELDRCTIIGNTATFDFGFGGGTCFSTVNDSILVGNSAIDSGGGAAYGTLNNCTIVENNAAGSGGGAVDAKLNNCIIYYNTAPTDNNFTLDGEVSGVLNYCCIAEPQTDGTGNFTNPPQFVNLAANDLHLQITSPCIDAGNDAYVTSDTDFEGNPRIVGASVDVGAYEFHRTGPLHPAIVVSYTNVAVGFALSLASTIQVGEVAVTSSWDFGDGNTASNQTQVVHAWLAPGDFTVTYTAFNDSNPDGVSVTQLIHVTAGNYYVALDNANPVYPYVSWDTAATNIQDAVDAAAAGSTVWVSNGVYQTGGRVVYGALTNRVAVTRPETILSVNGPEVTTIKGWPSSDDNAVRCAYLTNGVTLSGFTLTNGSTRGFDGDLILEVSGAGAWCESTNCVISNCILTGNSANWYGGGAYGGTLVECDLLNNYGYGGGGAGNSRLDHCSLMNNASFGGGGANSSTLTDCTLSGNFTYVDSDYTANGGGASACTLINCTLSGNQSISGGGACASLIINSLLIGNSSSSSPVGGNGGGGVNSSTLVNCTVIQNMASEGGGAISSTFTNCIVYFNTASNDSNYTADCTFNYSDTSPLPISGIGNLGADPLMADSGHISPSSPCIGEGLAAVTSGVDLDGDAWLNPPSMGCDEFNVSSAIGPLAATLSETYTNVAAGLPINFTAQIFGHAISNHWDFGDGFTADNQLTISHTWLTSGNYQVTFTVFNADNPAGVSASVKIFVVQQPVQYVALDNPTPAAPFTSWATAATNIQDAVDAAFAGGTLIVSNGVYQTGVRVLYGTKTNRVAVTKPLTIISVNGPTVTIIDGGNAMRCLYLTNHVSVTGFTLQHGLENGGAGVYCEVDDVLNNCLIISNSSPIDWSGGGGANGGTLNHCVLAYNGASYVGSGAANSTLNDCLVSNNTLSAYGSGVYGGSMYHCVVVGNFATWGGGLSYCTASNSIIFNNSAQYGGGGIYGGNYYNCTIISNTVPAGNYGGAGVLGATLNNCISYYNNGDNYTPVFGPSLTHSCTIPDPGGQLTVTNEPLFVDLAHGDYHLQSNSPCINSGDNTLAAGTNDFDGLPRISGGTVDIGAFEFQNPSSILSYAWAQQYGVPTDGSADYADTDGDGFLNWQESIARTDPKNPASALQMQSLSATNGPGVINITWQSVAGVSYFIQRSGDLTQPSGFSLIQDDIIGQDGSTTWQDTSATNDGPYFYRVGVH